MTGWSVGKRDSAPRRVVVFIDYQNAYRAARRAFQGAETGAHSGGQFDPVRLAQLLSDDERGDRQLAEVRLYRGLPSATLEAKSHRAAQRQIARWNQSSLVTVVTQPLWYPNGWPEHSAPGESPQERGVDVSLALDFALMASERRYDIGIVFSEDSQLRPALEYVRNKTRAWGLPRVELAAWRSVEPQPRAFPLDGLPRIYCHWLDEATYQCVRDSTDYSGHHRIAAIS